MTRSSAAHWVLLLATGFASEAHAYPELIGKGYTSCATCHYSPTGGGLPNSYGLGASAATFPGNVNVAALDAAVAALAKNDVTGYDDAGESRLQWDVGLNSRLMLLPAIETTQGPQVGRLIPMLIEAGGVVSYGPALAYATVTPRRAGVATRPDSIFSREHWLQFRFDERWSLRGGRLVLPYGLRLADHTQYVREELGLDKWGQSYALELDRVSEDWAGHVALAIGDLLSTTAGAQERSLTATGTYSVATRATLGLSVTGGTSALYDRAAAGAFARVRLVHRLYGLLELDGLWRGRHGGSATREGLAFARLGWFPLESIDLFAEVGGRAVQGARNLTKLRYGFGIDWHVLPWVELSPQYLLEEDVEAGMRSSFLAQLHVFY